MSIYRGNGLLLRIFFTSLIFAAGCANNSNFSEEQSSQITQTENSSSNSSGGSVIDAAVEDLKKWPDRLWDDTKVTFTRPDNITALLMAGGASVAMHQEADEKIADYFERHQKLRNFKDESLNIIGHPTTHFAASSLWYFLSAQNQDELNRQRAWTMRTALTITWLTTMGLKAIRNNETPNGKDWSWPSGHTSSSFTVAAVLDEFYGHEVGIPAYAVASLVAYRMIDTDDHWGSDIVFGATLGWVVGHTVAGRDKELEIAGFEVIPFIPMTEKPMVGIGLLKRF
jgi:hypothetical protein